MTLAPAQQDTGDWVQVAGRIDIARPLAALGPARGMLILSFCTSSIRVDSRADGAELFVRLTADCPPASRVALAACSPGGRWLPARLGSTRHCGQRQRSDGASWSRRERGRTSLFQHCIAAALNGRILVWNLPGHG